MIIKIKVKLYSKNTELIKLKEGEYEAYLTKIPIKGKANAELIDLISRELKVKKDYIKIKTPTSRVKIIEIKEENKYL